MDIIVSKVEALDKKVVILLAAGGRKSTKVHINYELIKEDLFVSGMESLCGG